MKAKRKHLKAAACAAIAASAFLAAPGSVHAETSDVPVTINYSAAAACRGPSVMIPKEISMKDELQADYTVFAYCEKSELGTLFDHVTVEPSESFTLTNERTGDTFTASVTQERTEFLADDVKNGESYDLEGTPVMHKTADGRISVDGIGEGRWTGAMTFYINEVAHTHRWIKSVLSADGLSLAGYAPVRGNIAQA